jgi:hypothetical protein
MQTHQDVWFSVADELEHIYFRAYHQPYPLLDFIPWPIRVTGVVFPDGSELFTANGGGAGAPSILAGSGISVTPGTGTVTIGNLWPQTPWQSDINGNGFNLLNVGNLGVNGSETVGGNLTVSGSTSLNDLTVQNETINGNLSVLGSSNLNSLNVSSLTINGVPVTPGGGGGGAFTTMNVYSGTNRPMNATFQNTTGSAMFVAVSFVVGASDSVGAWVGPGGPNTQVALVEPQGVGSGIFQLSFMVLPGYFYSVTSSSGNSTEMWTEWSS